MRLTRRQGMTIGLLLALAAAIALWMRPAPIDVQGWVVVRGPVRVTVDEAGTTRLPRHVQVNAPASGRLTEPRLAVGDTVAAGTVVAELLPAPLDARALEEARAAARAASAVRDEATARLQQAETALQEAQRQRLRLARLTDAGGASPRDLEGAIDAESLRLREVDAARARVRAATEEERRARTAAAGDAVRSPTRVRTPIAGRVLRIFEDHDRVVLAGTPLLEVGDPSQLEVVLEVLSRDAVGVTPGQQVTYRLPAGDSVAGVVTRVEPAAFTKVSALGIAEQRVRVVTRPTALVPGVGDAYELPASIVVSEQRDVVLLPAAALVADGDGWAVFVVRAGRAERRPVTLGMRGTREFEARGGVTPGDTLILLPDERIATGVRVRVGR